MPTDNFKKELSTKQETIQEARPRMCGWVLLKMAEDNRRDQQSKLDEPQSQKPSDKKV